MLINMDVEGNINVNNLVETIVGHAASRETINSILTAITQEQSSNIVLITSSEIAEVEGSISPSSFYGLLPEILALPT